MSDINLDFTVANNNIQIVVEPNEITFTPSDLQLTINTNTNSNSTPGGSNTQLQYNNNGQLGGIPNVTYSSGNLRLGATSNVKMTGGTNGYVLQTDGTGNLSWTAQTGGGGGNGTPGGSNTQIQYNDSGAFGGNAGFTFDEISGDVNMPGNLTVTGNVFGNVQTAYLSEYANVANSVAGANVTGEVAFANVANNVSASNISGQVANALVAGTVYTNAQPNITSTGTLADLSVAGNANIGNIGTAGLITATGNVTAGNINSLDSITAVGYINAGNFISSGTITTTGNAQFGNMYANSGTVGASILIGTLATAAQPNITSLGTLTDLNLNNTKIHLGQLAGTNAQGNFGIAIGYAAGANTQKDKGIAIGYNAGSNTQGNSAVAIGEFAGEVQQGANAIAIGRYAGIKTQGAYSIALGSGAAGNSLAAAQPPNSIILNASGSDLNASVANSFVVKPIRNLTQANYLYYDPTSGEITYDSGTGGSNTAAGANTQVQFNTANALDASANFTFNTSTSNLSVIGNLSITGNIIGARIYGAGNGLSNIQGANVTGAVSYATVANSVAAANISGIVPIANLTTYANVLTVNGVAMGNTYATFVSGSSNGNYQIYSNTVFKANILNGTFFATTFVGNLTGNVTGTVSTATTAGTVTTNAQPNITSVGTLTSLAVTGNITSGNANLGNLVTANFFSGNANALFNVQAANIVGSVPSATTAGTVTTNAQPNITSFGTLVQARFLTTTLSGLGLASSYPAGTRRFINDAAGTTFFAICTGGGSLACPVFSDGVNWRNG